jgi:hypothetical protein
VADLANDPAPAIKRELTDIENLARDALQAAFKELDK